MNNKFKLLGSIAVASTLLLTMNANALVLDDFTAVHTDGNFPVAGGAKFIDYELGGAPVEGTVTDPLTILGGVRDVSVELIQQPTTLAAVSMVVGGGVLSFSNDDGAGGEGIVQWDGASGMDNLSSVEGSLGGMDLNAEGTGFIVNVLTNDIGFDIRLEAYTSLNLWTKVTIETTGTGIEFISFAAMENDLLCGTSFGPIISVECGGGTTGTVDFSNLSALQFVINVDGGNTAVDLSIGPISTVPEPAALGLFGLGLLGAGFAGSRRRKNKA